MEPSWQFGMMANCHHPASAKKNAEAPVDEKLGRPTGFEPATPRSTILCSNQLSYDRRVKKGRKFYAFGKAVNTWLRCLREILIARFGVFAGARGEFRKGTQGTQGIEGTKGTEMLPAAGLASGLWFPDGQRRQKNPLPEIRGGSRLRGAPGGATPRKLRAAAARVTSAMCASCGGWT